MNTNMFHLLHKKELKTKEDGIKLGWSTANNGLKIENQVRNILYFSDKNKQNIDNKKTINTCPLLKAKYKNQMI